MRGEGEVLLGAAASGGGQRGGASGVAEDGGDAVSESGIVSGRGEERRFVVNDGFRDAGAAEGGDGQAQGQGFAEDDGQALGIAIGGDDAGSGEDRGAMHEVAHDGRGLGSEKGAAAQGSAGLSAERLQQGSVANDEESGGGVALLDEGHGADEMRAAFLLDETAGEEDDWVARGGTEGVGREEVKVDADGENAEFGGGKSASEGLSADVFGDAEEEAGAGEESMATAEEDAAGSGFAQSRRGGGDVVAMEGDEEGDAEMFLDGEGGGGVDGEVRVEQRGAAEGEREQEARGETGFEAGFEEGAAADAVAEGICSGKSDVFAGVEVEAGADAAHSDENGAVTAQGAGLGNDEGLGGRKQMGAKDEDGRGHETS